MAGVRDSLGSYTSPLRKSGENNFHKLERKRPGVQRLSVLERHLMVVWCNATSKQQGRKLRLRAGWGLSLGSWMSRAAHSPDVTKPAAYTFVSGSKEKIPYIPVCRGIVSIEVCGWLKGEMFCPTDSLRPKILLGKKLWRGWDVRV